MGINVKPEFIHIPLLGEVHASVVICSFVVWGLCALCVAVGWQVKHRWKEQPGRFQLLVEMGIDALNRYCGANGAHAGREMGPWILTVTLFIAFNCLVEFFSFEPPTGDLSLTLSLGILTFLLINVQGFRHRKLKGRLHYYIEPIPIVAPFKLLADIAVPISLACRLYGNILSGMIVMALLYAVIPIGVPAALSIYFTLFHALIQTYVFITLTLSFVREAIE